MGQNQVIVYYVTESGHCDGIRTLLAVLQVIPQPCEDQLLLVELVAAIRVLPTDTLIQTVKQVLKQPPPAELGQGKVSHTCSFHICSCGYRYKDTGYGTGADLIISKFEILFF